MGRIIRAGTRFRAKPLRAIGSWFSWNKLPMAFFTSRLLALAQQKEDGGFLVHGNDFQMKIAPNIKSGTESKEFGCSPSTILNRTKQADPKRNIFSWLFISETPPLERRDVGYGAAGDPHNESGPTGPEPWAGGNHSRVSRVPSHGTRYSVEGRGIAPHIQQTTGSFPPSR